MGTARPGRSREHSGCIRIALRACISSAKRRFIGRRKRNFRAEGGLEMKDRLRTVRLRLVAMVIAGVAVAGLVASAQAAPAFMSKRTGFEPEPRARVPRHEREAAQLSSSRAARSDNASGPHGGSPRHTQLNRRCAVGDGPSVPCWKSLELLSLSIASALDEQNDVHAAW